MSIILIDDRERASGICAPLATLHQAYCIQRLATWFRRLERQSHGSTRGGEKAWRAGGGHSHVATGLPSQGCAGCAGAVGLRGRPTAPLWAPHDGRAVATLAAVAGSVLATAHSLSDA